MSIAQDVENISGNARNESVGLHRAEAGIGFVAVTHEFEHEPPELPMLPVYQAVQPDIEPASHQQPIETPVNQANSKTGRSTSNPVRPKVQIVRRNQSNSGQTEDMVKVYLDSIGDHPILTRQEEFELAHTIEDGKKAAEILRHNPKFMPAKIYEMRLKVIEGKNARLKFIGCNLLLVVSIAKNYRNSGVPFLDLIQEGNMGMIHALDKFDHTRGTKFSTYASWWIKQALQQATGKDLPIRLPMGVFGKLRQVTSAKDELQLRLGRPPTISELSEQTSIPERKVRSLLDHSRVVRSLSAPISSENSNEFGDTLTDPMAEAIDERAVINVESERVKLLLSGLNKTEQLVLTMHFGLGGKEPKSLTEVGVEFSLTRGRIMQIKEKALENLREIALGIEQIE